MIVYTLGEMGKIDGFTETSVEEVKKIRHNEFITAMQSRNVKHHLLGFEDLGLAFVDLESLVIPLLSIVRKYNFGALFTFHPYEITPQFDHPDHNRVGEATRFVASVADVEHYKPDYPATPSRPQLFFWTTDGAQATHRVGLKKHTRDKRDDYLTSNYPSQFPQKSKKRWGKIFDRITYKGFTKGHQEYYQKVR